MTKREVEDAIRKAGIYDWPVPIMNAFADYMSVKHFGTYETLDAWHDFQAGWNACNAS